MLKFTVKRILNAILLMFFISMIAFTIINLPAGDPVNYAYGGGANPQYVLEQRRTELGYNQPPVVRYVIWLKGFVHGDLGTDSMGNPVSSMLKYKLRYTFAFTGIAFFLSIIFAMLIAVITAVNRGTHMDRIMTFLSYVCVSIPDFWIASMLVLLCSRNQSMFKFIGTAKRPDQINNWDIAVQYVLPTLILTLIFVGSSIRYIRSAVQEVMQMEYLATARSQGLHEIRVIMKYMLKNAMLPIITYIGFTIPTLINSAMVLEIVFKTPGIGGQILYANMARENTILMGVIMITAIIAIVASFLADLCYTWVDPRVRYN